MTSAQAEKIIALLTRIADGVDALRYAPAGLAQEKADAPAAPSHAAEIQFLKRGKAPRGY